MSRDRRPRGRGGEYGKRNDSNDGVSRIVLLPGDRAADGGVGVRRTVLVFLRGQGEESAAKGKSRCLAPLVMTKQDLVMTKRTQVIASELSRNKK